MVPGLKEPSLSQDGPREREKQRPTTLLDIACLLTKVAARWSTLLLKVTASFSFERDIHAMQVILEINTKSTKVVKMTN